MAVVTTKSAMRDLGATWRAAGQGVALVPISGVPHAGHQGLIARARTEAARTVVSITPFAPVDPANRDDAALNAAAHALLADGVDAVFLPDPGDVALRTLSTHVETPDLARTLFGKLRPGHYRAVATQIARLFNIVQPEVACFGEQDYQELCVIRQMVRDLDSPVRIVGLPTRRDPDGLAIARRNHALGPQDRTAALILSRTLAQAAEMAKTGITASRLRAWVAAQIQTEPRADPLLADIRDAQTLSSVAGPLVAPAVILLAVRFGKVLLIDQAIVTPGDPPPHLCA